MKILFCDYPQEMEQDFSWQQQRLQEQVPGAQIRLAAYRSQEQLLQELQHIKILQTAFIPMTREVFAGAPELQMISVNAAGYGNIDLQAARDFGVTVTNVSDYCSEEVAEHTMALLLALARHLKAYDMQVVRQHSWKFQAENNLHRLSGRCLALFGWGHISRRVAALARAFGLKVAVVSRHLTEEEAAVHHVVRMRGWEALECADILVNHMQEAPSNYHYFNRELFCRMKRAPIFINMGRGSAVAEADLAEALDRHWLSAAGLDVLAAEEPDLTCCPLLGRDNVILTPHAAFFSEESVQELAARSVQHMVDFVHGHRDRLHDLAG